jgi:nucleoside-diphosphate-sugar epimerase
VIGIDRVNPPGHSQPDVFIEGDLKDRSVADEGMRDADIVYHLAAAKDDWGISREEYIEENAGVTITLLESARQYDVHDHVFYSTVAVHGTGPEPKSEESPLAPEIPYGESKVKAERVYHTFSDDVPEARILILRPSAIYGRYQPWRTNVHRLIESIYKRRFVMIGDGDAWKTTSYVGNLIAANRFLVERMRSGIQTYIYVDEPIMPTARLVNWIYDEIGRTPPSWSLPLGVAEFVAKVADVAADITGIDFPITAARIRKFCTSTVFDASALRELGFSQPVSNEDAVRDTVRWQLQQYEVSGA